MKQAEVIIVKSNTIARKGNESFGPFVIRTQTDFKSQIQLLFDKFLRGVAGHIVVSFNGKMFMCERDNVNPHKPYVRHVVKYHPLADKFTKRLPIALLGMGDLSKQVYKSKAT